MVESGKSFIRNVQNQGRGGIYNNMKTRAQEVRQQRADQLENSTTINQLGDTDSQATIKTPILNKEQIAKDAEAIVNSKIGQKLIGLANTIGGAPEKGNLGAFSETFERGKERAEENLEEKKKFLEEDIYEDTAKIEKVAGIDEQGEQYIKSKAREDYEAFQRLGEARWIGGKKVKDMFPQYWQTTDGQREYRTDGQYVVNRPVGYTPDLLETMQDAYNSVTYAYAQDGVVLTPDDLKKAYPEYANVSDGTLANFISGCMFDVQNGKRSDIKTVGDAMGEMALTEGYTNRMDGYLDILSDESIISHGFDKKMAKNKAGEQDMIIAGEYLKRIVNEIRATGSFSEGLSDWAILSAYRKLKSDDPEVQEEINNINKYMTLLEEQEAHDGVQALVANLYNNYKGEMEGAKTDVESDNFVAIDTFREVLKEQSSRLISDMKDVMQEMRDQSEQEGWYPMKNTFENILLGKYYRDNEGNYYQENMLGKGQLAFSKRDDGTYMDAEGNVYSANEMGEINKQGFIGRMSTGVVGALASIASSTLEGTMDISRLVESGDSQYAHAVAADIIQGYFGAIMANPQVQYMFAIPGIGDLASNILGFGIDNIGTMYLGLLEEFGITDGWTLESKDKVQEGAGALGMIFASKSVKGLKNKIKANPKLRAIEFALRSYLGKLAKIAKIKNKKGLEKLIEEGNKAIEQERLEREQRRLAQQQTTDTTLTQDVRAGEKSNKIIEKETEKKKETAKSELDSKSAIPLFKLLSSELAKAKEEFFDEFYEEYKKQAGGEENMDSAVLLERDLRDMADPEKKQQLIDKYREIFGEEILERNAKERENFGREIMELKQEIMDSMKVEQEAAEIKDTKEVLEEEALPGKKPTKRYEKIEEEKLDLPGETRTSLRENPFRYILKDILKDFIEPLNKKGKAVDWDSKDIVKYKRKKNISRVEVQERIMEKWKEMAQQYMNKLKENQKKIFDFKKEFFDTDIDYDIKNFFTEFLKNTKVNNKLSELFKKGILSLEEVYDENGNLTLEVVYNGEQRMPSTEVRETMELFNDIIKELQKYWKDDKLLLDEASLYELRNMMKEGGYNIKGKEKAGTFADRAQDLYAIFNDYLDTYKDTTGIGKDIRPYDHAFSDYFELVDLLDKFFNGEGEIKKESRNRLINIAEKAGEKLNLLDKLIPGTKEMLKLMESGHDFITKMVTFMEATNYKTWFGKRVLKYGPMMLTAIALKGFLPLRLSAILAIPVGETVGEKVRNLLGRKRPSIKDIEEIFKQLDLTEEEIKILEEKRPKEFEKTLSDLDAHFDEALKEILGDYEKGRQTEEGPKAYDRQGNEVRRVDEDGKPIEPESKGGPDDTIPPTPPTPKGPKNPPENPPKNDLGEGMEKEISDIEDEGIMEELDLMENTSNKLQGLLEDMVKNAETKEEAKMIIAAAGLKATNKLLSLRDTPEVRKAKKDAAKLMKRDNGYKDLLKKIDSTEGDVQLVYVNALYKLLVAQKAPMSIIKIDPSEYQYLSDADLGGVLGLDTGKQPKNTKVSGAYKRANTEELQKEYDRRKQAPTDYDKMVEEGAKEVDKNKDKNSTARVDEKQLGGQYGEQTDRETYKETSDAENKFEDDIYDEAANNQYNVKNTEKDLKRRLNIKAKEGEMLAEETPLGITEESIESRDKLWFSFEKFGNKTTKTKNRTRSTDKGYKITNHNKTDYIDGGLDGGTAEIHRGSEEPNVKGEYQAEPTKVLVSSLEIFDKLGALENSLPDDTLVLDKSTNNVYTMGEIKRMDVKGETNKKYAEKYYEEQMKSYPEEVQDIFNEKDQEVSSQEGKSEPQETQTEQSSTKEEKTSNPEDIEEYFKSEKSDFDINELTEEELHNNISGEMSKEYNAKIGEEILKRFEARYDRLTLNEIRNEIEMADMWYGKEVKKKFKDLLKRKEKDEIDHLFGEDKKTAEETNADSLVEAIKKYNGVDVAEFISHKWDKKGKTHIHLKDMTASDSRSFQEFVMNHKDLVEIYDDGGMGYVIKFKPGFKDNIKKYLK